MNPNHDPSCETPNHVPQEAPDTVTIVVNTQKFPISPGAHAVAEIRGLVKAPAAFAVDQRVGEELVVLDPNGKVHIKGGEIFVVYPGTGTSS